MKEGVSLWLVENARVKSPRKSDNMRQRNKDDFNGKEKTMEEWIDIFQRRGSIETKFMLNPREKVFFHPLHGFFTYIPDYDTGLLFVPKMCGDGRYLRTVLLEFVTALKPYGCKGVKFWCSRKKGMYVRILGGKLTETKEYVCPYTGKKRMTYIYEVTWDDLRPGLKAFMERKEAIDG